jgi:hypothetical protein
MKGIQRPACRSNIGAGYCEYWKLEDGRSNVNDEFNMGAHLPSTAPGFRTVYEVRHLAIGEGIWM